MRKPIAASGNCSRGGATVLYDAANFTRQERDDVRAIAVHHGATARVIYVRVSGMEARARLHDNRTRRVSHDVRDEDFNLVVRSFEPPTGEPGVVVYDAAVRTDAWIRTTFPELLIR